MRKNNKKRNKIFSEKPISPLSPVSLCFCQTQRKGEGHGTITHCAECRPEHVEENRYGSREWHSVMNASSVDFFRDILFAPSAPFPALEKLWQVFERCCERRRKLKGGWFLGWFISGALLHPFPSSFLLFPLPHESVMSLSWGAAASLNSSSWGARS